MYWELTRRVSLAGGAVAGSACFLAHLARGSELFYSAWCAALTACIAALILAAAIRSAGRLVQRFLEQQRAQNQLPGSEQDGGDVHARNGQP